MEKKIYTIRKTVPTKDNVYYTRKGYGNGQSTARDGKPEAWKGSVLSNCVGYTFGRFAEMAGKWLKIGYTYGNKPYAAQNWWTAHDGLERSQTPVVGAVAVWKHKTKKDFGHVANVEYIYDNGDWLSSESSFNGVAFRNVRYNKKSQRTNWNFQGFILPPYEYVLDNEATLKKGDKIKIAAKGNSRKDGKGKTCNGVGWTRYILAVYPGQPYPYKVGSRLGITTGFYKASALKKA